MVVAGGSVIMRYLVRPAARGAPPGPVDMVVHMVVGMVIRRQRIRPQLFEGVCTGRLDYPLSP